MYQVQSTFSIALYIFGGMVFFAICVAWILFGYPIWRIWASKKAGEAELQQANREQQIQVSKAKGRLDAAETNKKAAVVEAEAVSLQIKTIGEQLTKHDLYLKWQWIEMMKDRPESSVIYIPTEAGLPILEAGKRFSKEAFNEGIEEALKIVKNKLNMERESFAETLQ